MKWCALFAFAALGIPTAALGTDSATAFTYHYGHVRSVNLALEITKVSQHEMATAVEARGSIAGKNLQVTVSVPRRWPVSPRNPSSRHAAVVFSAADRDREMLDNLLAQHFGVGLVSVFTVAGFDAYSGDAIERVESHPIEFGGFTSEEPKGDDARFLQCLGFLDIPVRTIRLAFLTEGYGGSPPKEVFEWLRRPANKPPETTRGK